MNILIAEDSSIIQMIHRERMNDWGYQVDIASDGEQAVEYAQRNNGKYDFCLMDVEMPKMNGIEATRVIRRTAKYFPIMGYSSESDYIEECRKAGMDDFATKPCPPEDLFAKINELSVKLYKLIAKPEGLKIKKVSPMNSNELEELRALKKQGLTKLKIVGPDNTFIVHKNIQNKITHELIGQKKELSEFIDRNPSEPGRCHLYKANLSITKDIFLPEELEDAIKREDAMAAQFDKAIDEVDSE